MSLDKCQKLSEEILYWITTGKNIKFGHVQAPAGTGKTTVLPIDIWSKVAAVDPKAFIVHAAPESEVARLEEMKGNDGEITQLHGDIIQETEQRMDPPAWPLLVTGYYNAWHMLEKQLNKTSSGLMPDTEFTTTVVFIIDLHLQCPADLALLFMAIVAWTRPGACPSRNFAVLTMSTEQLPLYLARLYKAIDCEVEGFTWTEPGIELTASGILPASDVAVAIQHCIEQNKKDSHCILVMAGRDVSNLIATALQASDQGVIEVGPPLYLDDEEGKRMARRNTQTLCNTAKPHSRKPIIVKVISFEDQDGYNRGYINNYDRLVLVMSSHRKHTIFDATTGGLATITAFASKDEKSEMLNWCRRSNAKHFSAYFVGAPDEHTDFERLLDVGGRHKRLLASGPQLFGLVSSLPRLLPWIENAGVIHSFVPEQVLKAAITHCTAMRILRQTPSPSTGGRPWTLEETLDTHTKLIFHRILPVCDYNAQLALFVALPTPSGGSMSTKINLAAFMTIGFANMIDASGTTQELSGSFYANADAHQNTVMRPLAAYGTTWLLVTVWMSCLTKVVSLEAQSTAFKQGRITETVNRALTAPVTRLRFDGRASYRAFSVRIQLRNVFYAYGYDMASIRAPLTLPPDSELRLFQKHLLQAFCSNFGKHSKIEPSEHFVYVTAARVNVPIRNHHFMNWDQWQQRFQAPQDGSLHGVHLSPLARDGKTLPLVLSDWNCIPPDVVAEWLTEHEEGFRFLEPVSEPWDNADEVCMGELMPELS